MNRIITLLTDYGLEDPFAGSMKGAILSINPEVTIVDITHGIKPFAIMEGALALKAAYPYFPARTIHVVVVDPGVGTNRRGLLVTTEKYLFVGPDNGVFSFILDDQESCTCYELTATHYFRPEISPTFHGRDIFGPVAAWLTKGLSYSHFGSEIVDPVRFSIPRPQAGNNIIQGQVMHIDRFGNLVTTITAPDVRRVFGEEGRSVCRLGETGDGPVPMCEYYAEVPAGEPCAIIGSSGFLEVAVNQGRATHRFGAKIGHLVTITKA